MPQTRRRFDAEFRDDAVRYVLKTQKPIAACARALAINEGTLVTGWPSTASAPGTRRG